MLPRPGKLRWIATPRLPAPGSRRIARRRRKPRYGFLHFLRRAADEQRRVNDWERRLTMRKDRISTPILTFALGAGIGAVVALLLAPTAGEELRDDFAEGVNDGVSQVRRAGRDLKRRAQRAVDLAKDQVQDAIDAGDRAYSHAKNA